MYATFSLLLLFPNSRTLMTAVVMVALYLAIERKFNEFEVWGLINSSILIMKLIQSWFVSTTPLHSFKEKGHGGKERDSFPRSNYQNMNDEGEFELFLRSFNNDLIG